MIQRSYQKSSPLFPVLSWSNLSSPICLHGVVLRHRDSFYLHFVLRAVKCERSLVCYGVDLYAVIYMFSFSDYEES